MVEALCQLYGSKSKEIVLNSKPVRFFNFPTLEQLSAGLKNGMEERLKLAGFGYRAFYVVSTVRQLTQELGGAEKWLNNLRNLNYLDAKHELQKLKGVGPKVSNFLLKSHTNLKNFLYFLLFN